MTDRTRIFEYKDEKSSKFWEITQTGRTVKVRYGKTGTNGQTQEKVFADLSIGTNHVQKLIAEKTGKGYSEIGVGLPMASGTALRSKRREKVAPANLSAKSQALKLENSVQSKSPLLDQEATPQRLMAFFGKDDVTNRMLAKHPRSSEALLDKLSHSSDKATRQAVTTNPNTAPETYVRLGQQFPKEFLANPALDLLLMMNPALMEEVPESLLVRLLKQADCPSSMLNWAAGHWREKVQLAVAMNAAAPEQALQRLRESRYPAVRQAVEVKPSTTSEQDPEREFEQAVRDRLGTSKPRDLLEAWSSGDIGLAQWSALPLTFRLAKAANDGFTPEGVIRGLRHESPMHETFREICFNYLEDPVIRGVASSPDTPIPILEDLANPHFFMLGDWSRTRRVVAGNPSTPFTILEQFSNYGSPYLYQGRAAVAENPAAPKNLLELLSKDSDYHVRGAVALNPSTSVSLLEVLAKDANEAVRWGVAKNHRTPAVTLAALSKDAVRTVRVRVAENPFTPEEVLILLAEDSDSSVQTAVANNESVSEFLKVRLLQVLSNNSEQHVRREVAANPLTPAKNLETLSKDLDQWIRQNVAKNPNTPIEILEKLATDNISDVKIAVVANEKTPTTVLIKLLSTKTLSVRQVLASQAHRSPKIWNALWKDTNDTVRLAVASCESLAQDVLDEFVYDSNLESVLVRLFGNRNLSAKSIEYITERLLNTPATSSAWYQSQLAKATIEISAAARAVNVLSYPGKDPNKAVLSTRAIAPLMALCAGPFIEPTRLVKVVDSTDWLVRAAVARNRGTPPNLIKKLCADVHPLVSALAKSARATEENSTVVPPSAQAELLNHERAVIEVLVRIRKATADESRDGLRLLFNTVTKTALGDRATIGEVLTTMNYWKEVDILFPMVRNRLENHLVALMWEAGAKALNVGARKLLGSDPECPLHVLRTLVKDGDLNVVVMVLKNPAFPSEEKTITIRNLLKLSSLKLPKDVKAILLNLKSGLTKLKAKNIDELVDHDISTNTGSHVNLQVSFEVNSAPVASLTEFQAMSINSAREVRCAAAKNISLPADLLEVLSKDADIYVRSEVAKNPIAPIYLLEILSNDSDLGVLTNVAGNTSTPAHVLEKLSKFFSQPIWGDTELGTPLLRYWGYEVRLSVAANPSTPAPVLITLALDVEMEVRRKVLFNKAAPSEARDQVLDLWAIPLRRALLRENHFREGNESKPFAPITTSDLVSTLCWLDCIPDWADNKALTKASRSKDWLTRLGAVLHPNASEGIMKLLQQDSDPEVALAASSRIAESMPRSP